MKHALPSKENSSARRHRPELSVSIPGDAVPGDKQERDDDFVPPWRIRASQDAVVPVANAAPPPPAIHAYYCALFSGRRVNKEVRSAVESRLRQARASLCERGNWVTALPVAIGYFTDLMDLGTKRTPVRCALCLRSVPCHVEFMLSGCYYNSHATWRRHRIVELSSAPCDYSDRTLRVGRRCAQLLRQYHGIQHFIYTAVNMAYWWRRGNPPGTLPSRRWLDLRVSEYNELVDTDWSVVVE